MYHVSWLNPLYEAQLIRNSYLMVDFFFVLSGFVMCHSYSQRITQGVDFRDFLMLRLGRLYPLHLTMLGFFVAREGAKYAGQQWLGLSMAGRAFSANNGLAVATNLLLVHSLGMHDRLTFNAPSWSISAEFYTYVLFGMLVVTLRNLTTSMHVVWFVALSTCSLIVLVLTGHHDLNVMYDFGLLRCTTSFFLGAASYLFVWRSMTPGRRFLDAAPYVTAGGLVVSSLFLEYKGRGPNDILFPLLAVIVIIGVSASSGSIIDRLLRARPLVYLGKVSYSIYMVHFAVAGQISHILVSWCGFGLVTRATGDRVISLNPVTGTLVVVLYVGLVLLVSHFTFTHIEEPFRQRAKALITKLRALRPSDDGVANQGHLLATR
jgi:peptidoglycan/LPS O-acetylase OafA/YrhL